MPQDQIATQRLCLTADREALVEADHEEAQFLYCALGHTIPGSAAERFGLVNGALPKGKAKVSAKGAAKPDNKAAEPGEDKSLKLGGDKSAPDPDNKGAAPPELKDVPGIGAATAKRLVAAGIAGIAGLAAIDPAKAPEVDGLAAKFNWDKAIASAKALSEKGGAA